MGSSLLAGQPTLESVMPTLLVVLLALIGATLLMIGTGWACTHVRSRSATTAGTLCLLGTIPAAGATAGLATGILFSASTLTGVAIVIAIAWMLMLGFAR